MLNIEALSKRIVDYLLAHQNEMDDIQKAKIEFGLSVLLGIIIEMIVAIIISLILKTTLYIIVIMLAVLFIRIFTGGVHCTSYRRCLVFTSTGFLLVSVVAKAAYSSFSFSILIMLCTSLIIFDLYFLFYKLSDRNGLKVIMLYGILMCVLSTVVSKYILLVVFVSLVFGISFQIIMLHDSAKIWVAFIDSYLKKIGI